MSGLKSNTLQSHSIPVKAYNPNSRASQMQKGFISPELKVARFFGAEVFDYDYSQDETNNILSYHINLKNDEDVIYLNYRLQELVKSIKNEKNFATIFMQVSYLSNDELINKHIAITPDFSISSDVKNGFYIYNTNDFHNNFIFFSLHCIITINYVKLYQSFWKLSEYRISLLKTILYGTPTEIILTDPNDTILQGLKKSLFTFVNLFENERFYTKWWKMFKYFKYRFMNK